MIVIFSVIGWLSLVSIAAQEAEYSIYPTDRAPTINLEVRNETDHSIGIQVHSPGIVGSAYYLVDQDMGSMETRQDEAGKSIGEIWVVVNPGCTFAAAVTQGTATVLSIADAINPSTKVVDKIVTYNIDDETGKERYVSYDGARKNHKLFPQTGYLLGLEKYVPNFIAQDTTRTGLPKRNNVVQKDLKVK